MSSFPNCLPGKPAWVPSPEEKVEIEIRKALVKAESLEAKRTATYPTGNAGHTPDREPGMHAMHYPRSPRVHRYRGPSFS